MAIPSVETYLQTKLKTNLNDLLSSSYIIKEQVLKDFDPKIVASFVKSYCTDDDNNGREVPVLFTFPVNKEPSTAFILIQFKGGTEEQNSIGSQQGVENTQDGEVYTEKVTIQPFILNNGFKVGRIILGHDIYKLLNLTNLAIIDYDVSKNIVTLPWQDFYENDFTTTAKYIAKNKDFNDKDYANHRVESMGFDVLESYVVDTVSQNQDTMRCLDAILKACLLLMRFDDDEQMAYRLQTLDFEGTDLIAELNTDTNSAKNNQLFYRRVTASYQVPYSINLNLEQIIKDIKLNNHTNR